MNKKGKFTIKFIAYTGMMTAIVYVATLIGVSTPVANFNIGDSAILLTAALFNPITAMIAGGLGAFLADLTTYPVTMLYTLVIKAIEGLLAGIAFTLIYKWFDKKETPTKRDKALKITFATLTSIVCTMLMVLGYYICKAFMYGTPESALTSLPKNVVQAVVSTLIAMLVLYAAHLEKMRPKTQLVLKDKSDVSADATTATDAQTPVADSVSDDETSADNNADSESAPCDQDSLSQDETALQNDDSAQ